MRWHKGKGFVEAGGRTEEKEWIEMEKWMATSPHQVKLAAAYLSSVPT